jgi:class 3 adenylate cyclase/tetratricopeptide (TPR) repeat protein
MKCRQCDCANDADANYCNACGSVLKLPCHRCGQDNRPESRFCKSCGRYLHPDRDNDAPQPAAASTPSLPLPPKNIDAVETVLEGERKYVTVLFTDLCGYTAMSDRMDPEEVKEILATIFSEIANVVARYEGFVEKFVGDAVMAVFGASRTHEDDPIRAVRAAREIHQRVAALSATYQELIPIPLTMHTGVNTGLVVLGHVAVDHGTHGISGDTVNLAARLSELGKEGDILVGPDTFQHCQGWFRFETLDPVIVKGKSTPLRTYRVLTSRDQPRKVHRFFGRRGAMIGRQDEMAQLAKVATHVVDGQGAVVCISGAAGTGKSRLLEEFKASIDPKFIAWYEGHAYAYARSIPYAPLIDLLSLACHIEEGDAPEIVREKIDFNLGRLLDSKKKEQLPYIGSLFGLHYPELGGISPEYWRSRLKQAVRDLLEGLARGGPVVVCIEDLHWADPSSVALLRSIIADQQLPLLLICTYRKTFSLTSEAISGNKPHFLAEIELKDLSADQTLGMVESMLGISSLPQNLIGFVQEKIEGNPFYLEEMINALIDRNVLVNEGGNWVMHGMANALDISSTIHGVVSGRLDHLEADTKRVLQEASVIGRVFDYAILKKITAFGDRLDPSLDILEELDMIRKKDDSTEVKYYFKHAVVQEVVYNGILIKDRRAIHERIAVAMERFFHSRLSGFYETLALHYSVGQSLYKAVDYLMKSGQKSKQRYAVDEAHQYYQRAYELLHDQPERSSQRAVLLVNVLIEWFFVFNVRGIFNEMVELLERHEDETKTLENPFLQGMYCCCMGWALQRRESLQESHAYLTKALKIGEKANDRDVLAYACGCLVWTCTDMGMLDKAVAYGRRAEALLPHLEMDQELIRIILTGLGIAHWFRGDGHQCQLRGEMLLAHGEKGADIRSTSDGYLVCAMGRFVSGDFNESIEYCNMAIASSAEMVHSFNSKFLLAYTHLSNDQVDEAEKILKDIMRFTENYGYEYLGTAAQALAGMVTLARGNLGAGVLTILDRMEAFRNKGKRYHLMTFQYLLGKVYFEMAIHRRPLSVRLVLKNFFFLIRHLPFASRKAERNFKEALAAAESIGAMGIAGQIYFDMAQLYAVLGKSLLAKQSCDRSIAIFQACDANVYLEKANDFATERGLKT